MIKVDAAVFAHNEETGIAEFLRGLASQNLLTNSELDVQLVLLANGCADNTLNIANETLRELRDLSSSCCAWSRSRSPGSRVGTDSSTT